MTEATFEKGRQLLTEIKKLKGVVSSLTATLNYKPKPA